MPREGPRNGDYGVIYGRTVAQGPRLELVRLGADDSGDTLVRCTFTPADLAGPRFEQEALVRAKASGTAAWRQNADGVWHRLLPPDETN